MQRRVVTRDDVLPLIRLEIAESQRGLVAANAVTLAQAAYETGSTVWGLWEGVEPVGLMAMIHPHEHLWPDPEDDPDDAYLWRLMIGAAHQRRGLGALAVEAAMQQSRDWGLPRLAVLCKDRPGSALPFYERLGFRRTGRIQHGEVELLREV